MSSETSEMREELYRLKARLAVAERQRSDGVRSYSLDDTEKMMRDIVDEVARRGRFELPG